MRSIFHAGSTRRRRAAKRIPPSPLYSYAGTWEDAGWDENTQKCEAFFTRVRHAEGGPRSESRPLRCTVMQGLGKTQGGMRTRKNAKRFSRGFDTPTAAQKRTGRTFTQTSRLILAADTDWPVSSLKKSASLLSNDFAFFQDWFLCW